MSILHSYATHPGLASEKAFRKLVVEQVDRTGDILQTMLNIAKGNRQHIKKPLNVNHAIEQALKLFPISNAEITLKLQKSLPQINGDEEDLQILFINLFKNTVEALHKAKVTFNHRTRR